MKKKVLKFTDPNPYAVSLHIPDLLYPVFSNILYTLEHRGMFDMLVAMGNTHTVKKSELVS